MKRIKTAAVLLAVLVLIVSCASCGKKSDTPSDSMEGFYRLVDAAGEGSYDLLELKDGVTLEVHGSTGTLSLMTDVHEITFDPETMTCGQSGDYTVSYSFDGTQLILDSEPFRMVFEKQ